jgi:hypothetical protein
MTDDALSSLARWHATVTYRTDAGPLDVPMLLREIWDLHDRIEEGPHWDTIVKIEIRRANHIDSPTLTTEQANYRAGEKDVTSGSSSGHP